MVNSLSYCIPGEIPKGGIRLFCKPNNYGNNRRHITKLSIEIEAMGCDIDLLCSTHPKVVPGRIVQIFKSIKARDIFRSKANPYQILCNLTYAIKTGRPAACWRVRNWDFTKPGMLNSVVMYAINMYPMQLLRFLNIIQP